MNQDINLIKSAWQWFADHLARIWFLASSVGLAILYLVASRRGRELAQLHQDAQRALLAQKLTDLQQQATQSQEDFQNAQQSYADLIRVHGDLLNKLGIGIAGPGSTSNN